MTPWCLKFAVRFASASLVTGFLWSAAGVPAMAQTVSADQIVKTLTPPVTRSMTAPGQPAMSTASRPLMSTLSPDSARRL